MVEFSRTKTVASLLPTSVCILKVDYAQVWNSLTIWICCQNLQNALSNRCPWIGGPTKPRSQHPYPTSMQSQASCCTSFEKKEYRPLKRTEANRNRASYSFLCIFQISQFRKQIDCINLISKLFFVEENLQFEIQN